MTTAFGLEHDGDVMTDDELPVDDLVEYCETQAGLLAGRAQTLGAETDALLDEIDADIDALRGRLSSRNAGTASPSATPETAGSERTATDIASLEEKQAVAATNKARMDAFQDLAGAYADLAAELETADDSRAALDRVVRFERDHDAPAYFEDRQTLLEAVADADE